MSRNYPKCGGKLELMGAKEAQAELGVTQRSNLRKVAGLPEPIAELAAGPVWLASEIRALARERRRKAA